MPYKYEMRMIQFMHVGMKVKVKYSQDRCVHVYPSVYRLMLSLIGCQLLLEVLGVEFPGIPSSSPKSFLKIGSDGCAMKAAQ
jgi:hypothetical protein